MRPRRTVVLIAPAFVLAFAASFLASRLIVRAFNGPPAGCTPPDCSGAVGVSPQNNLSVGTSSPLATTKLLLVASDTSAANNAFLIEQPSATPILIVEDNGNIGVGTSSPAYPMDVNGTLRATTLLGNFSGTVSADNVTNGVFGSCPTCNGGNYAFPSDLNVGTSTNATISGSFFSVVPNLTSANSQNVVYAQSSLAPSSNQALGGSSPVDTAVLGDLEIPSSNANSINEAFAEQGNVNNYGTGQVSVLQGNQGWAYNAASTTVGMITGAANWVENDAGTLTYLEGTMSGTDVEGGNVSDDFGLWVGPDNINGGNVTNRMDIYIQAPTGSAQNNWGIYQAGTQPNYFGGDIGIGTTNPISPLHVLDAGGNNGGVVRIEGTTLPSLTIVKTGTQAYSAFVDTANGNNFTIANSNTSVTSSTRLLSITPGGNVGIGTTAPAYTLDVAGSVNASGGLYGALSNGGFAGIIGGGLNTCTNLGCDRGYIGHGTSLLGGSTPTGYEVTSAYNSSMIYFGNSDWMGFATIPLAQNTTYTESQLENTYTRFEIKDNGVYVTNGSAYFPGSGIWNTSGDVGIGTTAPATKLDVSDTISIRSGFNLGNTTIGSNATSATLYVLAGNQNSGVANSPAGGYGIISGGNIASPVIWMYASGGLNAFQVRSVGWDQSVTAASVLFDVDTSGNVGIGTTSPGAKLEVNGTAKVDSTLTTSAGITQGSGYFTMGAYSSSYGSGSANIYYNATGGTFVVGSGIQTTGNITINGGSGKLNVGTVDPIYTIGGAKYATYAPGMTGQKEETAGLADLACSGGICSKTINFSDLAKGSDLWLFYEATDFGANMEYLDVELTPSFDGRVWYEKDAAANTLTIFGSSAGEISYRLTANRFDWQEWPNTSTDTASGLVPPAK